MSFNTKEILEYLSKDKNNSVIFHAKNATPGNDASLPFVIELHTRSLTNLDYRALRVLQPNTIPLNPLFNELTMHGAELITRSRYGLYFTESYYDISEDTALKSFVESLNPEEWDIEFAVFCERDEAASVSKELYKKGIKPVRFDMEQLQDLGLSHEEQVAFLKDYDLTGKIVSYADDACSYTIYVEKAKGSKIEGAEIWFASHYSDATYPAPDIPTLRHIEADLSDEDIYFEDISVREFDKGDRDYIENARARQAEFKKTMVKIPEDFHWQCYQEFVIDTGSYSDALDVTLINIIGFDDENPYVVNRGFYFENVDEFKDVVDTYASCKGVVLPDTIIRCKFNGEEFSLPYAEIKENPTDFLEKVEEKYRPFVTDFISALSEMEYGKEVEKEER